MTDISSAICSRAAYKKRSYGKPKVIVPAMGVLHHKGGMHHQQLMAYLYNGHSHPSQDETTLPLLCLFLSVDLCKPTDGGTCTSHQDERKIHTLVHLHPV